MNSPMKRTCRVTGLAAMPTGHRTATTLLSAGLFLLLNTAALGADRATNWSITPYAWATDTAFDLRWNDRALGGNVAFADLMDVVDTSLQIFTEAGPAASNWSAFVDLTYLKTSDDNQRPPLQIRSSSEQWFVDAAVAWWPGGKDQGFSIFGGLRYTDLDERYRFSLADTGQPLTELRNDRSFVDALIGVRQVFTFADRWSLLGRADYAGGDSEGIFQLEAALRFGMGQHRQYGLIAGYRYKEAEFKHDGIEENFTYQGPLLGFNFQF